MAGDFYSFEFYEKKWKKKCGPSQNLKHGSKKSHKQNVYKTKFYESSPKYSEVSPQTK